MKMKQKRTGIVRYGLFTALLVAVLGCILPAVMNSQKFGLDLKGGFEVLYEVQSLDGKTASKDAVTSTYKTMLKRIDSLGVSEPVITVEGDNRIRVQLAGVTDSEEARAILSKAASLTFRDTEDHLLMSADVLKSGGAKVGTDSYGKPAVSLSVSDNDKFYKITKQISESSDNRIVIWLDFEEGKDKFSTEESSCGDLENSRCLSVASVSQGFASDVIIQGNFTKAQVTSLVELINSGSLPTKLNELSSKNVEASFGSDSLQKTLVAGIVGVTLIMLFMIVIYRFSGLISSVGILIYTVLTFEIFWLIGGVLTLPGIAALVIGIGMAIDANVISFARIKDELLKGKSIKASFKSGNKESISSIIDSNVTTLLVAIILFIFGESSVKGFATMLIISIFVTMLVMVFLMRWLLGKFVETGKFEEKSELFIGVSKKSIERQKEQKQVPFAKLDFVKSTKWFVSLSVVIIAVGCIFMGTKGLNLSIDFKGGSDITLKTEQKLTEEQLQQDLKELGYPVEKIEFFDNQTTSIIVDENLTEDQIVATEKYFKEKYQAETDIGVVSNVVKKELVKNAIWALLLAVIGIIIYVSLRFKLSYAIGAIVSLLHDALIIVAFFAILHLEISPIFIAAILSIIGYSINDTIVTFDRIKENLKLKYHNQPKKVEDLKDVVNTSLRQTFARSIITTMTTLIPVVALILLGSHEIINFNIALLFGLVAGVYSSLFMASQIWIQLEKRNLGKKATKKWYEEDGPKEWNVKGINS